jgi:hypothetical protein
MRLAVVLTALLLSVACVNQPQSFAPPIQRQPVLDGQAPKQARQVIEMADPDADAAIVQDIQHGASGPWRWTGRKPTVRLFVSSVEGRKLKVHYAIADSTFRDTGPLNLKFFVNGSLLATVAEAKPGEREFERAVPRESLRPNADNLFAIEIDKVWVSKVDGAQLGMILTSIGLTR